MEQGNINWVLVIACLLAGIGIGALGYHLLNAGARSAQKLRQRLAERDRELTELRSGLDEHLESVANLATTLLDNGQALQQELEQASSRLGSSRPSPVARAMSDTSEDDTHGSPAMPRDYADGNRGTLSEDFGLKSTETSAEQQPPRY